MHVWVHSIEKVSTSVSPRMGPALKGIGSHHKSGTWNNQSRQRTTPRDNRCFKSKYIHSNSNKFSSPVIPLPPPLNDSFVNPPQLSSVCQQSSGSSQNTMLDSQASSIPGRNSPDNSNTMPPPSTKNGSRNIYGCMVGVSKLTPSQQQQHAVMLIQHYHELCNMNDPSSMFVSPPPIPNIESLSQSAISSLDSGSFGINWAYINIKQKNTSELANTETVMADNEKLDPPPPQDIQNFFAAAEFSSL